jgi:hypothetical protein
MRQGALVWLAGAAVAAVGSMPAAAQVPDNVVLNIMRECARIDDPTARLACYDNNIRAAGANPRSVPGQGPVVQGGGGVAGPGASGGPGGFGGESVKTDERFDSYEERGLGPDAITARVTAATQREPGVYLVTIDGDAQWLFSDSVSRTFRPPTRGSSVEIQRGALGSFLMVIDGQQAVRVRRVK